MPKNVVTIAVWIMLFSVAHINSTTSDAAGFRSSDVNNDAESVNEDGYGKSNGNVADGFGKDSVMGDIPPKPKWLKKSGAKSKKDRHRPNRPIRILNDERDVQASLLDDKISIPCKVIKGRQEITVRGSSLAHIKGTLKETLKNIKKSKSVGGDHFTCPKDKFNEIRALIKTLGPIQNILDDGKVIHHLGVLGFAALGENCASHLIQAADNLLKWHSTVHHLTNALAASRNDCVSALDKILSLTTKLDDLNDDIDFAPKVCLQNKKFRACFD
eukprot:Tbor_TRINITY_DN4967_c1_g1::TRINITY_DN4967_c1_g1_i1::g.9842::m.9842